MNEACGDIKNATAWATSAGCPMRQRCGGHETGRDLFDVERQLQHRRVDESLDTPH